MSFILILPDGSTYSAFNADGILVMEVTDEGSELLNEGLDPSQLEDDAIVQEHTLTSLLNETGISFAS